MLNWLPPGTRNEMEVHIVMSAYGSKGDIESMKRLLKGMGDRASSTAYTLLIGVLLKKEYVPHFICAQKREF